MNFLLYFQNIAPCNKNNRGNLHACIQVNELQRGMYFSLAGCWDCMKRGPLTSAVRNKGLYWGTAANGVSAVVSVGWLMAVVWTAIVCVDQRTAIFCVGVLQWSAYLAEVHVLYRGENFDHS